MLLKCQILENIMPNHAPAKELTFRALPSVDQLLRTEGVAALRSSVGLPRLTAVAREVTEEMRRQIQSADFANATRDELLKEAVQRIQAICRRDTLCGYRKRCAARTRGHLDDDIDPHRREQRHVRRHLPAHASGTDRHRPDEACLRHPRSTRAEDRPDDNPEELIRLQPELERRLA